MFILAALLATGAPNVSVTLDASDIEIGAVELKDATTDVRANIKAANTARTTATVVLAVQHVDAAGNVLSASPVLGAGTALVGKVGIDQATANANEVVTKTGSTTVVTALTNSSLNGPGAPTIDSYVSAAINAVTGTDQVLVAAPGANKQIWVYGIDFLTTVAGTVALQDEDNTVLTGVMNFPATGGLSKDPSGNFAMPWKKVATNKALEVDVVTATINGSIQYAIVSV